MERARDREVGDHRVSRMVSISGLMTCVFGWKLESHPKCSPGFKSLSFHFCLCNLDSLFSHPCNGVMVTALTGLF